MLQLNYDPLVLKVNATLKRWSGRDLSLLGKVHIVNTLIASLFVYKMFVLPNMPRQYIRNIEQSIEKFLWNGHKPKITMEKLKMSKKRGGLGLVDLEKKELSIKAT